MISDADLANPANFPDLGERFEVLSFIGQGGMGAVYKVKDKSINQILAIKLLNDKFAQDPTGVKRFETEAKASCQLTHANLVTIYDYCRTTSGVPFIVMDFLDGKTLADFIKQNVYLTVPEALDIFCQIADALTGVHSKGIIHRDLKPANILLLPGEGGYMVKLVDFGIAKVLPEMTNYATTVTESSELTGSPLYMSPEQCQGERVDARSDIYSLGCVMYEALTGVNPFMSDNQIKVILAQISSIPRPFRQSLDIPNCLQALVFKCLKKSPSERYQTAARLLKDLEAMRDGKDVAVLPEPTSAALTKVGDEHSGTGLTPDGTNQSLSAADLQAAALLKKHVIIGVSVFVVLTLLSFVFTGLDKWQPIMMIFYALIGGGVFAFSRAVRLAVDKPRDEQILETDESVPVVERRIAAVLQEPIVIDEAERYWGGSNALISDSQRAILQSKIYYTEQIPSSSSASTDVLESVAISVNLTAGAKTQIKLTFDCSQRDAAKARYIIRETTGRISKACCLGALQSNEAIERHKQDGD